MPTFRITSPSRSPAGPPPSAGPPRSTEWTKVVGISTLERLQQEPAAREDPDDVVEITGVNGKSSKSGLLDHRPHVSRIIVDRHRDDRNPGGHDVPHSTGLEREDLAQQRLLRSVDRPLSHREVDQGVEFIGIEV